MKDKQSRQQEIVQIIKTSPISNQKELNDALSRQGFEVTQATLSRDLNELHIVRIPDLKKGYVYAPPENFTVPYAHMAEENFPLHSVRSITFSHNLAVIKCMPSFAPSIAMFLDELGIEEIIGTIAGDDTIFVALKEGIGREQFLPTLLEILPELRERIR